MPKTKSSLYEAFSLLCDIVVGDSVYVVDGGFLIHRVIRHQHEIFSTILDSCAASVKKHYKETTTIVFNGYPEKKKDKGTKGAERVRQMGCATSDIILMKQCQQ